MCFQDAVHDGCDFRICDIQFLLAFGAFDTQCRVVSVLLRLGGDGKLRDLSRRLIAVDRLSGAADVEGKRMAPDGVVKQRVLSFGSAATVEALEADIEASGVVLWRKEIVSFVNVLV